MRGCRLGGEPAIGTEIEMSLSNVVRLVLLCCFAAGLYLQSAEMARYRPAVADFVPKATITGVFKFEDYGKSLKGSWIDGHSVFVAANYAGGTHGFGHGFGIPNGSKVTADIAEIETANGTVWIATSIRGANRQFVSRTPQEMHDAWLSASRQRLVSESIFDASVLLVVYFMIIGVVQFVRRAVSA